MKQNRSDAKLKNNILLTFVRYFSLCNSSEINRSVLKEHLLVTLKLT